MTSNDTDACARCDFIGPVVQPVVASHEFHRTWHRTGRDIAESLAPVRAAYEEITRATQATAKANRALGPDPEDEPMLDPGLIEVGDTVELTLNMSRAIGPVTRIDPSVTSKGIGVYIEGYPPYPLWIDTQHTSWTLAQHTPLMPDLVEGTLYDVTTRRGDKHTAAWAPIDGIRANHPWLEMTPGSAEGARYRQDFIIRARPVGLPADATRPPGDCDVCGNPFEPGDWWNYHYRLNVYVHHTCASTLLVRGEDISSHAMHIGRVPTA